MATVHIADQNITVDITLDAPPVPKKGFGTIAYVAEDQPFGATSRALLLTSDKAASEALFASTITAAAREAAQVHFSQSPRPGSLLLIHKDDTDDTYPEAIQAASNAGFDFYGVAIDSRSLADVVAVSDAIEAQDRIFAGQVSDPTTVSTGGLPTVLLGLAGNERTGLVYHTTDSQRADLAWLAARLAFDPDVQTQSFEGPIKGVSAYLNPPITTFARVNHVNLVGTYGPVPTYIDAGVNVVGRPMSEILIMDWLAARCTEALIELKLRFDVDGLIIPVDLEGYWTVRGIIQAIVDLGIALGKIRQGQVEFDEPSLASFDEAAQRIIVTGRGQVTTSARLFDLSFNLSRTAVAA